MNFNTSLAGAGVYIKRLLYELTYLKPDLEIHLFLNDLPNIKEAFEIDESIYNCHLIDLSSRLKRILFEQFSFSKLLRQQDFDIYYSPTLAIPRGLGNIKKICTIHDLIPFYYKKYGAFRHFYYKFMCRYSAREADKIVTVSSNSQTDIMKLLGVANDKIEVIYNFLPHDFKEGKFESSGIAQKYFLFVGTLQPGKNAGLLIASFAEYLRETKEQNTQLVFAGNFGWKHESLEEIASRYRISENIRSLGYVSTDRLKGLYKDAWALVYPSLYEGFGIPPLEAMSFETTVIVSNCSSLPEVVGDSAIFIDPLSLESIKNGLLASNEIMKVNELKKRMPKQINKFNSRNEGIKFKNLLENI